MATASPFVRPKCQRVTSVAHQICIKFASTWYPKFNRSYPISLVFERIGMFLSGPTRSNTFQSATVESYCVLLVPVFVCAQFDMLPGARLTIPSVSSRPLKLCMTRLRLWSLNGVLRIEIRNCAGVNRVQIVSYCVKCPNGV